MQPHTSLSGARLTAPPAAVTAHDGGQRLILQDGAHVYMSVWKIPPLISAQFGFDGVCDAKTFALILL